MDINWKRDGKWLLNSMRIWDRKCVWNIIWLYDSMSFLDVYRKRYVKLLLDGTGIWDVKYFRIVKAFQIFIEKRMVWDILWFQDSRRF